MVFTPSLMYTIFSPNLVSIQSCPWRRPLTAPLFGATHSAFDDVTSKSDRRKLWLDECLRPPLHLRSNVEMESRSAQLRLTSSPQALSHLMLHCRPMPTDRRKTLDDRISTRPNLTVWPPLVHQLSRRSEEHSSPTTKFWQTGCASSPISRPSVPASTCSARNHLPSRSQPATYSATVATNQISTSVEFARIPLTEWGPFLPSNGMKLLQTMGMVNNTSLELMQFSDPFHNPIIHLSLIYILSISLIAAVPKIYSSAVALPPILSHYLSILHNLISHALSIK